MRRLWIYSLVCGLAAQAGHAIPPPPIPDYYVSPKGNDAWSGRLAEPNATRTDGPFASITRARDAVRALRAKGYARSHPYIVALRGGIYPVREPLQFTQEDTGTPVAPLVFMAWKNERPVISGGVTLKGWKQGADGRWTTRLADNPGAPADFMQLWVNGERRYRPRLPKRSYFRMEAPLKSSPGVQGLDRFRFPEGSLDARWSNRQDIDVLVFQSWTMARLKLAEIEPQTRAVRVVNPVPNVSFFAFRHQQRFLVENVKEALGEPGEWYLDKSTGTVTYIPRRGERIERCVITVPVAEALVRVSGDLQARKWAEHIQFFNIQFEYTNWICPPGGYHFGQAEVVLPSAIQLTAARNIRFEGCTIRHTGGYALEMAQGARNNIVYDCELTDLGAGGVKIGEMGVTDADTQSSQNIVMNNLIAHGGRIHPAGVGVWIGVSGQNRVSNNTICDLYYSGISCGWTWGYAPNPTERNILERNHIAHIGQGVLSDMGGIYTLGSNRGSIERQNLIHDVQSYDYGGWGIYFDEGTSGILAENNVVFNCRSAGFHQHYGRENIVRNNLFAFNQDAQMQRSRMEEHLSFTFERNVVVWRSGDPLASLWGDNRFTLQNNLYWRTDGQPVVMAGKPWADWQAAGHDKGSVIADPGLRDTRTLWRGFASAEATRRIGFQPIDLSYTGRVRADKRLPLPALAPPAYPTGESNQPVTVTRLIDSFEMDEVGSGPTSLTVIKHDSLGGVVIADDGAPDGKHYLKLIDAPGQPFAYVPHVLFSPSWTKGVIRGSFQVRVSPDSRFYHEWRDQHTPYRVGPTLHIEPDGRVRTGDQQLTQIPLNTWVKIQIECSLQPQTMGRWSVRIEAPGQPVFERRDLSSQAGLQSIQWVGFVSDGVQDAVIGLDALRFEPLP